MNKFVKSLFLFCVFVMTTNSSFSEEDVRQLNLAKEQLEHKILVDKHKNNDKLSLESEDHISGRSSDDKESKPIKEFVTDIFKIYKSTYLGNKTFAEYRNELNKRYRQQQSKKPEADDSVPTAEPDYEEHVDENQEYEVKDEENDRQDPEEQHDEEDKEEDKTITTNLPSTTSSPKQETKNKLSPTKKPKSDKTKTKSFEKEYNVGPALNLSLDMSNNIVKVNLDGESLKELVTGRWLNDNTEQGRGKKYEMVTRILPLFILPFLIQSAIVPFLVTKLKLLLMKSILVGKLAIFLLIVSAFRNSNKQMQTYEVAPSYWAGEPSRRSELAAAASNMAYNGYRVEGKPAAWVN